MENIFVGYVLPMLLCGIGLIMFKLKQLSFVVGLIFIVLAIIIFIWNAFTLGMEHNILGIIIVSIGIMGICITIAYSYWKQHNQKNVDKNTFVLRDIGNGKTDNECALWDFGKLGYSAVPYNDTWKEWISSGNGQYGLVVTVNKPDLDYYHFGDEFYFVNLKTNKKISIPTGNRARNEKVGNFFHNGMVVRLMPRKT